MINQRSLKRSTEKSRKNSNLKNNQKKRLKNIILPPSHQKIILSKLKISKKKRKIMIPLRSLVIVGRRNIIIQKTILSQKLVVVLATFILVTISPKIL